MIISEEAKKAIRHDSNLRAKLMLAGNVSEFTINKWVKEDNDELTKPLYTNVIIEHTELTLSEVLTNPEPVN